ncbi:cell envelope integrity protein TolA [Pseudosulfitobacter pseudonitzschiae]|uniref:cell envelope integrity protein TolA n=1 Tax=Pseudosulfitobacter pseudonitzschiae TaxID=1402135 RepID=UPI001AFAF900|nr:cell envelope integrity protein TolA [Pseudosulfitobacter pseudonitzschiae]MBM1813662.1 TonB family protein [Pseudosulfitobacter pseudonitzschiae]MBM1830655.1 TonB family protein [Pseudosulfitobacter pseudonitzschiae]MBM1835522.1 TonB family protein [Pseudosulfitobacter pseudonitzschiae]MBM1840368.1 TonB family protein [Pseudosulfitobacter pseudonitzschiae]MBM1845644.1 TonB family protein [Pseudosulfitobacter pseudonitzschiae]
MIRRSWKIAALFLGCSVAAHAAMLSLAGKDEAPQVEGGAPATVAELGNSFADMAAGVMTPDAVETVQEVAEPPAQQPDTAQETPPEPVEMARAEPVEAVPAETQPSVVVPVSPVPTTPLQAREPPSEVTAALTPEVQQALPEEPATQVSRRPALRPKSIEAQAPKPQPKPAPKPKPQPKGNAKANAVSGNTDGQAGAKARAAADRQAAAAAKAANAAASNYPGQVMARIARLPRPRTSSRGSATIAFTIAGNGGLSGAQVAASSGSAQLDQAALDLVRRASPFPPPPKGAQRSFSIRIKGR